MIALPSEIKEEKKVADKKIVNVVGIASAPQNRKFAATLYAKLTQWLADGSIKVCPRLSLRCTGWILTEAYSQADASGGSAEWTGGRHTGVGEVSEGCQRLEASRSSSGNSVNAMYL